MPEYIIRRVLLLVNEMADSKMVQQNDDRETFAILSPEEIVSKNNAFFKYPERSPFSRSQVLADGIISWKNLSSRHLPWKTKNYSSGFVSYYSRNSVRIDICTLQGWGLTVQSVFYWLTFANGQDFLTLCFDLVCLL